MMKLVYKALIGSFVAMSALSALGAPQGRVSISQASFVSPDYQITEKRDYSLISAGLDTLAGIRDESEIDDSLHAQARGMVAPGNSVLNYLDITQLFWKQNLLTLGRKKINWNELDERFKLGIYQPLFQWNPLQWESQGLTGLFLHFESEATVVPWGITLLGSPLYIPNQGAGYEIKDGVFEKSNPYFRAPPTQAVINGQVSDVHYNIQKPEVHEVVYRQSFAGRAYLGDFNHGPFAQIGFASKPMNDLSLGFKAYGTSDDIVNVDILPAVASHQVLSADLQYNHKNFRFGISGVRDTPKEAKFKEEWTYCSFESSTLVSPFVEARFFGFEAQASALAVRGGESIAHGPDGSKAEKFIPQRFPFRNASLLGLKYQYKIKRFQSFAVSTKYLRGEDNEFELLTAQGLYQWSERWAGTLTSQMVAVSNTDAGRKTAFNSYLNNDVVALGVSYVF